MIPGMSPRVISSHLLFCRILALVISTFSSSWVCGPTGNVEQVQREDAYITAEVQTHHFRGAVLVGMGGRVVFEKGYGAADDEWDARNTPTTKFRIASLTKQFTAACILLLQERGQLNVNDRASKYLPSLPRMWQAMTIHQLLTHTSGVPNPDYKGHQYATIQRTGATPEELVAFVADQPLEFKPGTGWNYTNTGYIVLGMIIEKTSGKSYAEFLKNNIFEPLIMSNSGYDTETDILKKRASGYQLRNGELANANFIDMSTPFSAGGIYSTVEDLYRWNEALAQNGKLLSAASLKEMFTEYPEAEHEGQHYGYGVVISRQKFGKLLYYHGGGTEGFSSSIQRYPQDQLCIIVLSNLDSVKPWEMGDHLASDIFNLPMPVLH